MYEGVGGDKHEGLRGLGWGMRDLGWGMRGLGWGMRGLGGV